MSFKPFCVIRCKNCWRMKSFLFFYFVTPQILAGWNFWSTFFFCFKGVFIICWLPFFLTHVLKAHCRSCCISPSLYSAVTWLGYLNSAVNPVIYTTFNIEFRKAFIKILHCWLVGRRELWTKKPESRSKSELWSCEHLSNTSWKIKEEKIKMGMTEENRDVTISKKKVWHCYKSTKISKDI